MVCYAVLWFIAGFLVLFKVFNKLTCGDYKGKERLDGKTVVVTGSNTGIGAVCAKDFARRGARVIMACRDIKKAEGVKEIIIAETKNSNVVIKHVDFNSLASVRKCANEILTEEQRIDILLNNAGALGIGFKQTPDGLDELMQVNHFSPFLFTNILLGKIKESAPSRIVNVSSAAYLLGSIDFDHLTVAKSKSYATLYADSKLANIHFTNELANKLTGIGVTANSLHPGLYSSEINRSLNTLYNTIFDFFCTFFFKTVEEGAQTSIYLCVSPNVNGVTGKYFQDCREMRVWNNAGDMSIAKKLWEASEDAVKLRPNEKHY